MSKSEPSGHDINSFDEWVVHEFDRSGGFTALAVLIGIGDLSVVPLRSTFFHVIGDEITWAELSSLLASSGVKWDGVLIDPRSTHDGGPISDSEARISLRELDKRILEDRMVINQGHFFDTWGRRMRIQEAQAQ